MVGQYNDLKIAQHGAQANTMAVFMDQNTNVVITLCTWFSPNKVPGMNINSAGIMTYAVLNELIAIIIGEDIYRNIAVLVLFARYQMVIKTISVGIYGLRVGAECIAGKCVLDSRVFKNSRGEPSDVFIITGVIKGILYIKSYVYRIAVINIGNAAQTVLIKEFQYKKTGITMDVRWWGSGVLMDALVNVFLNVGKYCNTAW